MARSRLIKPSFFDNEVLGSLEPLARLLFIGLWNYADREGRLEDRPERIKKTVLGYDDCDCDELLRSLANNGFIERYTIDEKKYINIVNFKIHQNPHKNEAPSVIPPNSNDSVFGASTQEKACNAQEKECSTRASYLNIDSLNIDPLNIDLVDTDVSTLSPQAETSGTTKVKSHVPFEEVKELYNNTCASLRKIRVIDGKRTLAISARFTKYGSIDAFKELFEKAEASPYLKGDNKHDWKADFDWLVKATNMAKVLEGKYDARAPNEKEYGDW